MKKVIYFCIIAVLCSGFMGWYVGDYLAQIKSINERNANTIRIMEMMSSGYTVESGNQLIDELRRAYSPFNPVDLLAWRFFCAGDERTASSIWTLLAEYSRSKGEPLANLYASKVEYLSEPTSMDRGHREQIANILQCGDHEAR